MKFILTISGFVAYADTQTEMERGASPKKMLITLGVHTMHLLSNVVVLSYWVLEVKVQVLPRVVGSIKGLWGQVHHFVGWQLAIQASCEILCKLSMQSVRCNAVNDGKVFIECSFVFAETSPFRIVVLWLLFGRLELRLASHSPIIR